MDANLRDRIIAFTISQFEGGNVNHKNDRGGITNFGITKPFYAWTQGIKPEHVSDNEIRNLSNEDAIACYQWAWNRYKVDAVPAVIQHLFWDMCVNHGIANTVKILQRVLNSNRFDAGVVDGQMGAKTISAAAEAATKMDLLSALIDGRLMFYRQIIQRDPTQKVFAKGWNNRALWFKTHALVS